MKYIRSVAPLLFLLFTTGSAHAGAVPKNGGFLCNWFPSLWFCSIDPKPPVASVPEIDASSSTKAIALLAGALLLAAEIRRRKQ